MASLLGLVLLSPPELVGEAVSGSVAVTGFTDSMVSSSVVTRGLTTSFPLCTMCMELAAQLESRGAELNLEWIPRATNAEADRLADGDSRGFSPSLRVKATMADVKWLMKLSKLAFNAHGLKLPALTLLCFYTTSRAVRILTTCKPIDTFKKV